MWTIYKKKHTSNKKGISSSESIPAILLSVIKILSRNEIIIVTKGGNSQCSLNLFIAIMTLFTPKTPLMVAKKY
jgi:hypothetical protein